MRMHETCGKYGLYLSSIMCACLLLSACESRTHSAEHMFGGETKIGSGEGDSGNGRGGELEQSLDGRAADDADAGVPDPDQISVKIDTQMAVEVSEQFLSFAIDASLLIGGQWWSPEGTDVGGVGGDRVEPLDWSNPELRALVKPLAPAILRIGGTEADHIFYDLDDEFDRAPEGYDYLLKNAQWEALTRFSTELGFELMFTLNFGPGPRNEEGQWLDDQARILMGDENGGAVAIWELGNELNGYPLFHRINPTEEQWQHDLRVARAVRDELVSTARLAGPACAYWPEVGELNPTSERVVRAAGTLVPAALDIVTWHYYPQQSRRCPGGNLRASPNRLFEQGRLDEVSRWAQVTEEQRDSYLPQAEVWLGETGHAQCGGEPTVSDTLLSSFWWLDQLGLMARRGQSVVIRQALYGGTYGLINEQNNEPRPDYWASLAWKQLMGSRSFSVELTQKLNGISSDITEVRGFAHCAPSGGLTLLLLDRDGTERPLQIEFDDLSLPVSDALMLRLLPDPAQLVEGVTDQQAPNDLPEELQKLRSRGVLLHGEVPSQGDIPAVKYDSTLTASNALSSVSILFLHWPNLAIEKCPRNSP